jgi:hypothetical protein
LYVNFFQPSLKLSAKERRGSKVLKQYDKAQTPYQRVLDSTDVAEEMKVQLRRQYEQLDPVAAPAVGRGIRIPSGNTPDGQPIGSPMTRCLPPPSVPIGLPAGRNRKAEVIAEAQQPEPEQRTYRRSSKSSKHHLVKHTWRTRPDPFVLVREQIEQRLEAGLGMCAKELLQNLQQQYPGQFNDGQLRTLQRCIKQWREQHGLPCEAVIVARMPIGAQPPDLLVSSLSR